MKYDGRHAARRVRDLQHWRRRAHARPPRCDDPKLGGALWAREAQREGGHRLYTREQVEQLRFVKEGIDRGLQPAEAHRLLDEQLARRSGVRSIDGSEQVPRLLILLAERDPYAAEFAEFFLQTEGYDVALALDVDDAALKLELRLPQLAVIELLISGGTGAELCQRLKEAGVPACLVISTLDARDQALAAGADAFLQKPLDPLQFVSTVKDLLGKSAFLQGATSL